MRLRYQNDFKMEGSEHNSHLGSSFSGIQSACRLLVFYSYKEYIFCRAVPAVSNNVPRVHLTYNKQETAIKNSIADNACRRARCFFQA